MDPIFIVTFFNYTHLLISKVAGIKEQQWAVKQMGTPICTVLLRSYEQQR